MHTPPDTPAASPRDAVLVTGFDPFGGDRLNPSWEVAQALHGRDIGGHRVVAGQLPTEFGRALPALQALLQAHRPRLVVCCGQAGGRAAISLERVAINVQDARIADNAGARPIDEPVVSDPAAPAAYFTSLPIKAMRRALLQAGIPAEVSQTAGTFVCNHVFYGLMHQLARGGLNGELHGVRGGFIHLPWLPGQGTPSMPLAQAVTALDTAIACALATPVDIRDEAGALD
jgi:pyroglutamyl-peptidase